MITNREEKSLKVKVLTLMLGFTKIYNNCRLFESSRSIPCCLFNYKLAICTNDKTQITMNNNGSPFEKV